LIVQTLSIFLRPPFNFNIDTTDAKISLSADKRTVLYDADGAGSNAAVVVGTISKGGIPVVPNFSDLKGLGLTNGNTLTKTGGNAWSVNFFIITTISIIRT
jgi:hypothetical protein